MLRLSSFWVFVGLLWLVTPIIGADESSADDSVVGQYLDRGEFAAAKQRAAQLDDRSRDQAMADIAVAQTLLGDRPASALTLSQISSPSARSRVLDAAGSADRSPVGGGGGAQADFTSLIDLIQNTVNPDTWDALGGPSTIREYPQGVFVDPNGLLKNCETLPPSNQGDNLSGLLDSIEQQGGAPHQPKQWRAPARLRCVSLRRIRDAWAEASLVGGIDMTSITHLAGLSSIQYAVMTADDIVIAGPVGGIENRQGWLRDRQTGLAAIRFDVLATTIRAAREDRAFGCTIDPTRQGLQQAATVATQVQSKQLPIGKAADALANAIGLQDIEVFGTTSDTALALLMVEADRHMKELALGVHPMPEGVPNYLDVVDANLDQGVPNDLLLRLWFTAHARPVRADPSRQVFELTGTPIQLSGQNERAVANGDRGNLTRDFRSEEFVKRFNENWSQIRSEYPIYAGLESVYQAARLAALVSQNIKSPQHQMLLDSLAALQSSFPIAGKTPRQVETIAVLHRARQGRKRYNVIIASGGVAVRPLQTLTRQTQFYPPLSSLSDVDQHKSKVKQDWWWDVR